MKRILRRRPYLFAKRWSATACLSRMRRLIMSAPSTAAITNNHGGQPPVVKPVGRRHGGSRLCRSHFMSARSQGRRFACCFRATCTREASALAHLCNSLYRNIPAANLETRVATLELQVGQQETEPLSDRASSRSTADGTEAAGTDALLDSQSLCSTDATTSLICAKRGRNPAER
jgi:hypothetical protein